MFESGKTIADRYELLKPLGRGGFSEVWLAKDRLTDVNVAIKIYAPGMGLDDAGISLFTQEFSLVFDMNHTNLLHPTHYDCWERMPYLILPFCKNGSAFKYIADGNGISESECWNLLHDVAEGLAYLHAKTPPIIHQDIKPDNILINDENHYMITDFGISARIRSTLRRNKGQDTSGGTLAYMGPERFSSTPTPIMASDIWSLGATIYELMTGMPPYGDHGGILQKNGAEIPLIEADFSQALKDIVYKCLSQAPWDRPTARQIADYTYSYINGDISEDFGTFLAKLEKQNPADAEPKQILESLSNSVKQNNGSDSSNSKSVFLSKLRFGKKTMAIVGVVIIIIVSLTFILGGDEKEASEEAVSEPDLASSILKNDKIYGRLIDEGFEFENMGNTYRMMIDSLPQHNDSVFEDYYIRSLEIYNQVSVVKDSVSEEIFLKAKERISAVEHNLDSAYQIFCERADLMKELGQEEASETFRERAAKIELYINSDKNE